MTIDPVPRKDLHVPPMIDAHVTIRAVRAAGYCEGLEAAAGVADALADEAQGAGVDLRERGHVGWADLKSAEATGARRVAVALRAKAGEAGG